MLKSNKKISIVLLVVVSALFGCNTTQKIQQKEYAINDFFQLELNGIQQSVVIKANKADLPVLIHLHGGPGYPLFPYLKQYKKMEKHFTMVYWEQRGTASSYSNELEESSMTTDTLLSDIEELVKWIKKKYNKPKVFIWGHSWGSNLGLIYAARHPENLYAYIGTGQSVHLTENERRCYNFAQNEAEKRNNKKALRQLSKIDTVDYTLKEALKVRKWVYAFGGIVYNNQQEKNYINTSILKKVFKTPQYSFADKWQLITHSKYSGKTLWDDMMTLNLYKEIKEVNVPVYFFEGKHDHLVSSALAAEYFDELPAKKEKKLIWFNHSAHRPHLEQPEKFLNELLKVKSLNY